jgi:hypothetical protein
MTSPKQAAANRRNAERSTGPRTVAGKAIARLNSLKHGGPSLVPVIPHMERVEDWEGHRSVDVHRLHRVGTLRPGYVCMWSWWRDGEQQASIGVSAREGAIELRYTIQPRTADAEVVRYEVPLEWTPCTFGGRRPWFRCPGIVDGRLCGRRAAKLYLGSRYVLCRRCHGLAYKSQREDRAGRALRRTQNIRIRLGGEPGLIHPFPPRPKRMRRRTYARLRRQAEQAELESWVALAESFELLGRERGSPRRRQ